MRKPGGKELFLPLVELFFINILKPAFPQVGQNMPVHIPHIRLPAALVFPDVGNIPGMNEFAQHHTPRCFVQELKILQGEKPGFPPSNRRYDSRECFLYIF